MTNKINRPVCTSWQSTTTLSLFELKMTTQYQTAQFLHLMVKLSRLLPHQPIVLLLSCVIDKVGDHKGGNHSEERGAHSPESIWNSSRDCSSKCSLLHRRQVVLGGPTDGHPEVTEPHS